MLDLRNVSTIELPTAKAIEFALVRQYRDPSYRLTKASLPTSPILRTLVDLHSHVRAQRTVLFLLTGWYTVHLIGTQDEIQGVMDLYLATILGSDRIGREGN